jgi:probable HAF family extracellular repeat protein
MLTRTATMLRWFSAAAPLAVALAVDAKPQYREVDLSGLGNVRPFGINNGGFIPFRAFANGAQFSIIYDSRRGQIVQTFPAGENISALSENLNSAGSSAKGVWFAHGDTLIRIPLANASGVNEAGQVSGFVYSNPDLFYTTAALYSTVDGTTTTMGFGGTRGAASAVNASGQVTGSSALLDNSESHAFRWSNGVIEDLGTLGGTDHFASAGVAIDASGRVAGTSTTASGETHPFLFDGDGMHDIGLLPGCTFGEPSAMNDRADIVGRTFCQSGSVAFLYAHHELHRLNDVATAPDGALYATAWGINNAGSIVGFALPPAGPPRAYLLVRIGGHEDE